MKHKDNIYLVIRDNGNYDVLCGAYPTAELADEKRAVFEQDFRDRGLALDFSFHVRITTYFDE